MAAKLGSIKAISGQTEVIAVDKSGNERILKVGDSLYEGESIKTTSPDAKVVIAANDGKEVSIVGEDTISLDPKEVANAQSANPEIAALQNALLNGANITDLEETAAGAGGDGVSLGAVSFAEGGHYANINENFRNLTDSNRAFASFNSPIGGYADANDAGASDIGGSAANSPVAIKISLDGNCEAREATPNEYLVYNLGLSAPTSSTTPTDLTLNLSGATAGKDYSNVIEYSIDGGNNWTQIQNGGTISGVSPSDIANVKVRVQVIDDYGQTAGNQNEGTSSEDLGANIAPGIKDYGVYKEGVTLSVTTNNAAITSGEAEGKIIDNDDKIDITQDINPNDDPDAETIIDHSLINYDPDNGNTMKTIIDTKDGDDTITIKEGVEFRSGLYGFKDDGNDVLNIEKSSGVSSTKIDMGNAGGEKNQDTVNINSATVVDTRITSHNGNDVFMIKEKSYFDNVLLKTGDGNDTVNFEKNSSIKNTKVDTGSGGDVVNIKTDVWAYETNNGTTDETEYAGSRTDSFIKTGEGNDTINVTGASINRVDIDSGDSDTGDTLEFISAAIRDSEIKSGNGDDKYKFENATLDNATTISTGEGDDTIDVKAGSTITGSGMGVVDRRDHISLGEGDDVVNLEAGSVIKNSNINLGNADAAAKNQDTVNISGEVSDSRISSFSGNDIFTVNSGAKLNNTLLKTGDGKDVVNLEKGAELSDVKIDTFSGDDVVNIHTDVIGSTDAKVTSFAEYNNAAGMRNSFISTGDGKDELNIDSGVTIKNTDIITGKGGEEIKASGIKLENTKIDTEEDNGTLEIKGSQISGTSELRMGSGNDKLNLEDTTFSGVGKSASQDGINLGNGDDELKIKNGTINNTIVDTGTAAAKDVVEIENSTLTSVHIKSRNGNDEVSLLDGTKAVDTKIDTREGNDTITLDHAELSGGSKIDAGAGNDTLDINASNITGTSSNVFCTANPAATISTGEGDDTINVTAGSELTHVAIDTGNADNGDMLNFIGAKLEDVNVKSGSGNDKYTFENGTSVKDATINPGEGDDTIKIGDDISMTNTSIHGGNGRDLVELGENVTLDGSTINGGEDIDTLKIHDGSFNTTQAGKISGFEVLDMSEANEDFTFHHASDIANFIKNVGGEDATSLIVKGTKGVGTFTEGTSEIADASTVDSNGNYVYNVNEGGQTFTLTIQDVNVNESM